MAKKNKEKKEKMEGAAKMQKMRLKTKGRRRQDKETEWNETKVNDKEGQSIHEKKTSDGNEDVMIQVIQDRDLKGHDHTQHVVNCQAFW